MTFNIRYSLFILVIGILPTSGLAASLLKGPYLQDVRSDGIVVAWETDVEASGAVEYGSTAGYGAIIKTEAPRKVQFVTLQGLKPGATYHYRILIDSAVTGKPGTFTTAPDKPAPFTFLLYGDNRSNHEVHELVVSRMLQHDPAFVINSGDMVANGEEVAEWQTFFDIEADLIRESAIYPTIGNHEEHEGEVPESFRRLFRPTAKDAHHNSYYSFDYSNAHFVVLDLYAEVAVDMDCFFRTGEFEACMDAKQTKWLLADLEATAKNPAIDHVFVIVHEGPYSSKLGRTGRPEVRSYLEFFAEHKVKIVLSGHDHYYEHGLTANRIHYVISGGGGAPLYEMSLGYNADVYPHNVLVGTSVHNFLTITVVRDTVYVTSYYANGDEIDVFSIGPRKNCVTTNECKGLEPGACEGHYLCSKLGSCLWICDKPPECTDASQCILSPPENACDGEYDCVNEHCKWQCHFQPECLKGADCDGKAPLNDCPGGSWACQDEVCEWICPPPPKDEGPAEEDSGLEDEGQVATDPGAPLTDPGTTVSGQTTTTKDSSDCSIGSKPTPMVWLVVLFAAVMLARFRRMNRREETRP